MNAPATTASLVPAAIGAAYEGGFYAGTIRMFGMLFAVAVASKAQGELKGKWLDSYTGVPGAQSYFDSMENTKAMAEAGSDLAKQALALEINGHKDWCIPSRDVLELCYRHFKPTTEENAVHRYGDNPSSVPAGYPYTEALPTQTAVAVFQDVDAEAFEEEWYWSSTQYSDDNAWIQYFRYGNQTNDIKSYEARARAVRLIQLGT